MGRAVALGAGGLVLLLVLALLSCAVGSREVALADVWAAVIAPDPAVADQVIVRDLRVPRTVVAIVVGACLGAAGVLMQAVTRNPLAEPGLLGINAGAAVVVATGLVLVPTASAGPVVGFAFAGAAASGVAVLVLGGGFRRTVDPVRLVLAGAALSVVLGAVTASLVINNASVFAGFRFWDAGAIVARPWEFVGAGALLLVLGVVLGLIAAPGLDALALGADLGRAMGVSPLRTWVISGLAVVVLAGAATALAGPVSFVGLAAPMIARGVVGPGVRRLLPLACVLAADALLLADILGRVVARPREIQAAIVCALVGAPIFIAFARRRKLVRL